jgi:hypothetical protein
VQDAHGFQQQQDARVESVPFYAVGRKEDDFLQVRVDPRRRTVSSKQPGLCILLKMIKRSLLKTTAGGEGGGVLQFEVGLGQVTGERMREKWGVLTRVKCNLAGRYKVHCGGGPMTR